MIARKIDFRVLRPFIGCVGQNVTRPESRSPCLCSRKPWSPLSVGAMLLLSGTLSLVVGVAAAAAPAPIRSLQAMPAGNGQAAKSIIVLKDQVTGLNGRSPNRRPAVLATQAPIIAKLRTAGVSDITSIILVNAIVASITPDQASNLAANPAIAEVIPDSVIRGPVPPTKVAAFGSGQTNTANTVSAPCGTSTNPELDPEALANIHATPAELGSMNGQGITVAFLADGIDTTNADFQRNAAFGTAGSPVITEFDFSGDGTAAPTAGGEAFLDASSIAAQGNVTYDLSQFVNAAHPLPTGCDINIVGVAPGSNVEALKIFAQNNDTTESGFLQAIDYAVSSGALVINESFGANQFPDTALDVTRQADEAAVAAGVTVVVSSGDAGITSTIGSPATDPAVISVGATTTFRSYAQTTYGGINEPKSTGYTDNNISGLSSGGFSQAGNTLNLVAPGDLNWTVCTANTALYTECTNYNGVASAIQLSGGTSESSPLTAGAAADVIQAYAATHGGSYPSPALVKQILLSTATDISAPATEQGVGLLNVAAAVAMAESITGTSAASSGGVLASTSQVNIVQQPGATTTVPLSFTNTGSSTVNVALSTRVISNLAGDTSGTFCMQPAVPPTMDCGANTGTFPIWSGVNEVYQEQSFTVPATGVSSRLVFTADYQYTGQTSLLHVALLEPDGTYAGYSLAQGLADYGRIEVANPPAGTWTAVFFTEENGATSGGVGTSGPVQWDASTFTSVPAGRVAPASLTLAAGQTANATLTVTSPSTSGDSEQSIVVNTGVTPQTTIPVTVRTLVPVNSQGGSFSGVVTGGNGRSGAQAQSNTYVFNVPSGNTDLDVSIALATDPNDLLIGYLVDPYGQTVGYSSNYSTDALGNLIATPYVNLYHVAPVAGQWSLVLYWANPVNGTELSQPFTGAIGFNQVKVTSSPALPNGGNAELVAGATYTVNVMVNNTGLAPEAFFVDPRLNATTTIALPNQNGAVTASNMSLPLPPGTNFPYYFVPTHTSQLQASLKGSAPVNFDLEYFPGDPDVEGVSGGNFASLSLSEPEVSPGYWLLNPSEIGPYPSAGAPSATASAILNAVTEAFDPSITSSAGDAWGFFNGISGNGFTPIYVAPGTSGAITVTITPQAVQGTTVTGTLYVDDYTLASNYGADLPNADEIAAIPYSYTIANGAGTLVFTQQPATTVNQGDALGTVAVTEQDSLGNTIDDSISSVTFTVSACGNPVTLGTVTLSNGVGTLTSAQRFYTPASGLQITANDGAISQSATSNGFSVVANGDLIFSNGFESCRP